MRKYRLTIFFAVTAVVVIAVAAIIVNHVVGNLAEENLIRIAEENTIRDGMHMQGMMRHNTAIHAEHSDGASDGHAMQGVEQTLHLTMESLVGPEGLDRTFPMLSEGLNVVKFDLFDVNGTTVWSTDASTIGITNRESPLLAKAAKGETSSKLVADQGVADLDGVTRTVDVVETYSPVRDVLGGEIIGAMGLYRDIAGDVALQVDDAKSAVLLTTLGTMGGLFLVLLAFIVVADANIYRSRRRELSMVEEANRNLEGRVRERTRELEESNSQLLQAQEHLVRSEKLAALGQLAGGVAHDLRNPLGAINNAVYYLKKRLGSSQEAQSNPKIGQFLEIVEQEVDHSNKIITDLMGFARVKTPDLSSIDIGAAIEDSLSGVEIRQNVRVNRRVDPGPPEVMADCEQLRRVFMNLAANAQDAMPDGGDLTISSRRVDGFAELAFSDTGTGILEEDMKKVFDPLFTTKTKGTGLGLAICQEILSKHGGSRMWQARRGRGLLSP